MSLIIYQHILKEKEEKKENMKQKENISSICVLAPAAFTPPGHFLSWYLSTELPLSSLLFFYSEDYYVIFFPYL
eukprot:gene9601-6749_t